MNGEKILEMLRLEYKVMSVEWKDRVVMIEMESRDRDL